jgi:hypothetical protein
MSIEEGESQSIAEEQLLDPHSTDEDTVLNHIFIVWYSVLWKIGSEDRLENH